MKLYLINLDRRPDRLAAMAQESRKAGLSFTRIAAMGETLDPNKHQAMLELPSDQPPGTIVQEMQPGYMIKDRLLRPALVGVAKAAE